MKEWSIEELVGRLESGLPVLVLDIREAQEHADWHIPGSMSLPTYNAINSGDLNAFARHLERLPADRPIVAVCRRGNTSRHAVRLMSEHGLEAINLKGGMQAWGGAWTEAPVRWPGDAGRHLIQVRRNGKGCLSYLLGSAGQGAVVDPAVDPDVYLRLASRCELTITHVFETHVHADHVSRARTLCERTGAALYLASNRRVTYPYEPLAHDRRFDLGGLGIRVLATPGHTHESVCYLVDEHCLLSGDTLFVDGVGRPDLEHGQEGVEESAKALFQSLHRHVLVLPEAVTVLPGHSAGAIGFDGAPVQASLGELTGDLELLATDGAEFVRRIRARLGAHPPNYHVVIAVNEGKLELGPHDPLELEAGPNRCAVG